MEDKVKEEVEGVAEWAARVQAWVAHVSARPVENAFLTGRECPAIKYHAPSVDKR